MSQYLIERIEQLKAENEQLRKERDAAEKRLVYERDIFERRMHTVEDGIAEQFLETIRLELSAIREISDHVDDRNKDRLNRRVDRIEERLSRLCNNEI